MLTDVAGVRVGHWTDAAAETGCTAVLFPSGSVASGEVRGGAPATREMELLAPHRRVSRIDAVMLCGGSAFGLAACDGAMAFCEERGLGHPTPVGPVPIVVGLAIFDLIVGDPAVRPGAAAGRSACEAASGGPFDTGNVGAGCGARLGFRRERAGGVGTATERSGELVVSALMVANAAGYPAGEGPADVSAFDPDAAPVAGEQALGGGEQTVVGVIATNAILSKAGCLQVAGGGQDGIARAIDPPHTTVDGDAMVAAATGGVTAPVDVVRALAVRATAAAIAAAVEH